MVVCEVCGRNKAERTISQIPMCECCFSDLHDMRNGNIELCKKYIEGYPQEASQRAREYFRNTALAKLENYQYDLKLVEDQEKQKLIEKQKQDFANSFNVFYEYDVVTLVNEDHGQVDKIKMIKIMNEKAREGWKLHTIYSNELGKNALRILGFGVNTTACEDVMIFERRIEEIEE